MHHVVEQRAPIMRLAHHVKHSAMRATFIAAGDAADVIDDEADLGRGAAEDVRT